jgi:hypothetical protein
MTISLAALHPGAFYHCETLEGARYKDLFGRLIVPETLNEQVLSDVRTLMIPSRTNPDRLRPHLPLLMRFLGSGGTLVAMGETFQDTWLPNVSFTPVETNYWWWLQTGAKLGVSLANPDHPLMNGMQTEDVTWHLHGWYNPPEGVDTLITDGESRSIFYVDETSYRGRLVITSLDPCYHHGSHFMPATTRFLDRFLPNLRIWSES